MALATQLSDRADQNEQRPFHNSPVKIEPKKVESLSRLITQPVKSTVIVSLTADKSTSTCLYAKHLHSECLRCAHRRRNFSRDTARFKEKKKTRELGCTLNVGRGVSRLFLTAGRFEYRLSLKEATDCLKRLREPACKPAAGFKSP